MKLNINFLLFATLFLLVSCGSEFESLNVDPNNPEDVPGTPLFADATKELVRINNSSNVNRGVFRLYSQYWAQTTYPDESQYNQVSREIPQNYWGAIYPALYDLQDAKAKFEEAYYAPEDAQVQVNQINQAEIMMVYGFQLLVDAFGDVPYSEALNPNNTRPAYDDALVIYKDLINRLTAAINAMDGGASGIPSSSDYVYQGDVDKWIMFANSLKLRLAMRLSDIDPTTSKMAAEEAAANVFASNADMAQYAFVEGSPNSNPVWEDLVQSGRADFVISNTIVDYLQPRTYEEITLTPDPDDDPVKYTVPVAGSFGTTKADPRLYQIAASNTVIDADYEISDVNGNVIFSRDFSADVANQGHLFLGGIYGSNNSFSGRSQMSSIIEDPALPGAILNYAEVCFLMAEAKQLTYNVPGTVEDWIKAGIQASCEEYHVDPTDAMNFANTFTLSANPMEDIAYQKWISQFNNGLEGWSTWRKFDYPAFNPPPGDTQADIPVRFLYPTNEASLNEANVAAAASAIGGDLKSTKLFWDVR